MGGDTISFKCSASCGDIIYSLIAVAKICTIYGKLATYYVHHNDGRYSKSREVNTYEALSRLLEAQGYVEKCLPYEGQEVDYDLDKFRKSPRNFAEEPLPLRFMDAVGLVPWEGWQEPWLYVPQVRWFHGFDVLNVTGRYGRHGVNFREYCEPDTTLFVGLRSEHRKFAEYRHMEAVDLLHVAKLVAGSTAVYCNQSAVLTIAQGLGRRVFLAKDKRYNNTIVGNNTTIL